MSHFIFSRFAWLFLLLLILMPLEAGATEVCLLDGWGPHEDDMSFCSTTADTLCGDNTAVTEANYAGARVNGPRNALTPVDVRGTCRYIDNGSRDGYFVPFGNPNLAASIAIHDWSAFLAHPPTGISLVTCARPFSGQNPSKGLLFGPTSARPDMGDTGAITANVTLPYARTGTHWPPSSTCANTTHTFAHRCYEEVAVAHCWNWVPQTCESTVCSGSGSNQTCSTKTYDCPYCNDWGSVCQKNWRSWKETFSFVATAGNPSWSGQSTRISTVTRPDARCTQRCKFNGHDCTDCNCAPTGETTCIDGTLYDSCGDEVGPCEKECCCEYWGF